MRRSRFVSVVLLEAALLLGYFAATRTALPVSEWLDSFRWDPVTGPFHLERFAGIVLMSLSSLAVYGAWLLGCWGAGAAMLKRAAWKSSWEEEALVGLGLGLGSLSLIFFIFGAAGLMGRPAAFLAAAALLAAGIWGAAARELPGISLKPSLGLLDRREDLPLAVIALFCLVTAGFHLCGALLPPLSFDEMNYQLSLPNLYIINGGFVPTPFNHLSFLPKNMGMLFAAGLLTGGAGVAKLFSWGMGVLAAVSIFVFSRRPLGGRAAFLGAALFVLAPVVGNQFRVAGADLGTAFYELTAVFLLLRWTDEARKADLALSSVFWGFALGCKYTALPGFFAGGCVLLYFSRRRKAPLFETAALYGLPALALWSPWLIKNWIDCGNPVAPLLSTIIPSRNFYFAGTYQPTVDYTAGLGIENYFPIRGLADLLRLPWELTVRHNDFNHDLGAVFIMCLPLWAFVDKERLPRRIGVLFWLCSLYWGAWLLVSVRMSRYFVAGMGLTSLLCGWLLHSALSGRSRARNWALAAPFLIAMTQQSMRMIWIQNLYKKPWGYLTGRCGLEDYLHALQPDSPINAERFINDHLPRDAKILVFNEFRTFYLERDFLASTPWDHDYWHQLVRLSRDPDDFYSRIKGLGITHFLANDNYVMHQVGVPLLHPDWWTKEDREKGVRFLRACAWTIFRDDGVWVARFFSPAERPRPKTPPAQNPPG